MSTEMPNPASPRHTWSNDGYTAEKLLLGNPTGNLKHTWSKDGDTDDMLLRGT